MSNWALALFVRQLPWNAFVPAGVRIAVTVSARKPQLESAFITQMCRGETSSNGHMVSPSAQGRIACSPVAERGMAETSRIAGVSPIRL
jgi:hypothetical protein